VNEALLELRGLRKSFGERRLLDIPRLVVPARGCVLLSGPNGAGKTTLLRIIAGLEPPDRAQVVVDGSALPWAQARRRYARGAVYLHQQPYVFDRCVADNVAFGLKAAGVPRRERGRIVEEALDWAGLTHLAQHNARELSGGERQRVALTRARVLSPRLLLLDEPTASLDTRAREQTYALIRRLRDEGMALLVTSHEPEAVRRVADAHLHLEHGRLHPAALATQDRVPAIPHPDLPVLAFGGLVPLGER
jgi:tungstate transport system ATP-binding protein